MSREIKIKYVYKHITNKNILEMPLSLELDIENIAQFIGAVPNEYTLIDKLQYTGLKDKKGVEIYEGDIVFITNVEGEQIPLEVYFEKNFAGFGLKVTSSHWCYFDEVSLNISEVIGNIHQNKDLLK